MSSVYEAVHRNGKRVAVKVLSPDLTSNRQVRGRFVREGYIANRIDHPGAVAVLDDERDGELVFLVMELLEGETLSARARRGAGRLAPQEVAWAVDGLLDVLAAAHARGIVHRDLKPANVFVTRADQVKLLDFGIASVREISVGLSQTRSGCALGTPGFMAPEQARGRWNEVDARTDLWSVGATMYQLLTGQLVHPREYANETMIAAATVPAPSLGATRPDLPSQLVAVVDRALAFEPGQRWQSALEMQQAVREVREQLPAHQPLPLPPAAALETATVSDASSVGASGSPAPPRWHRRSIGPLLALAAAAALALAFLSVRPRTHADRPSPAPPRPVEPVPPILAERPPTMPAPPSNRPAARPERRRARTHPGRHPAPSLPPATPTSEPVEQATTLEPAQPPPPRAVEPRLAPPVTPPRVEAGPIVSGRPRDSIPAPRLAPVYQAHGAEDLARVCHLVEEETVARAGVTPAFATGVTGALRHALESRSGAEIYPVGMYYFIISEAALGHDQGAAAHNLLVNHRSRALRRLASRVAIERSP